MRTGILLLFVILSQIFLNAQTCLSIPKQGDTVWIVNNGKKQATVVKNSLIQDTVKVMLSNGKIITVTNVKPVSDSALKALKINPRLMPDLSWESISDVMNFQYDSVESELVLNRKFEFCKPYSPALHNSLKSADGNFVAYMEHYFTAVRPIYAYEGNPLDSVVSGYNKYFNNIENIYLGGRNTYLTRISMDTRNKYHFYTVRNHLIDIAKKYDEDYREQFSVKDLKINVHYFPDSYAKTKFNADTVLIYTLPVKPVNGNKAFSRKYSRCEVLVIQKKDTGPVFFYCFYTGKGYKKRDNYMEKLEKTIKFKD